MTWRFEELARKELDIVPHRLEDLLVNLHGETRSICPESWCRFAVGELQTYRIGRIHGCRESFGVSSFLPFADRVDGPVDYRALWKRDADFDALRVRDQHT